MNGEQPSLAQAGRRPPAHTGLILAIACVGQFMVILDVSIVTVALPSIGRDLHYSATGLQWVVNAYVLTFAGFLLLGGRAADLFGQRRVYLAGMALFTVASLAGGIATDSAWLTAARAFDMVADVSVAYVSDRYRTPFGRRRPWCGPAPGLGRCPRDDR